MPLYEYQCQPHNHRFEVRQGIKDEPVQTCPECGGPVRRVIHPVGIVFKGSGFYATDSKRGSASAPAKESASDSGKSESASGTTSESKSEAKTESKGTGSSESKAS